MLIHKDMQNFEMDSKTSQTVYNKIMKDFKRKKIKSVQIAMPDLVERKRCKRINGMKAL